MKKTIKLYDHTPYGRTFAAQIVSAKQKKDSWEVVLDQTLFFPEEGGQCADTGKLYLAAADSTPETASDGTAPAVGSVPWCVTDAQIRDGVIYHEIRLGETEAPDAGQILQPGSRVRGEIDWDSRFSNMQNHTGEHIISGLIHTKYGFDNVGFHLSKNIVTLDQSGYLTPEQVAEIEREANRVVWADLPVTAEYLPPEEAKEKSYRSKIEIEGEIRLVTIGGRPAGTGSQPKAGNGRQDDVVDVCACCAPHVAYTGEIGLIKILRSEKYKGGTRLTILCGDRALVEVTKRQFQIEEISHLLRAKQDEALEAVRHLYEENAAQKERLIRVQEEKIRHLAEAAGPDAKEYGKDQVVQSGANVWIFSEDLDPLPHRNLVNMLVEKCEGFAGVFLEQNEAYRFIIGSRSGDCRKAAQVLRESFGAKGGGKPEMVQGSVQAERHEIIDILKQL